MEAYGLYYSYTQYWTHSSKGYLVHRPCFPRYTCLDIQKCTKFKRLSHYLIRCVHRADFHYMEAYGLYYSYTQYWTHSSKGYLVHGPCFPRYTCLDIRKCTKFKRLSHYLIRCVHKADFHFMEAYGLYYWYTQYWTHSSKGYLVHGPCFPRYSCLDIWKCTKFKRLSHYLIRCVQNTDFHFMEAYGLYYSYTQYWTHSSKGYLVHGPCFPRYTCLDIRKCTKFKRLSHYLIRCVHRADFHFMEAYGLYYSYTQYWTHSSKGYLVHRPCFPRYTCLDIQKCTKFKRLSHYLIRYVHKADFHFMEDYGLYYSYSQSWTHSSKGYLVHGPCFPRYTCRDIQKCTKFKRLSHYLICCVHRADFHFMEAYGLFYSCTQYWTHSSTGYLVHGPCFPRYTCLDIWKCTKFKRLSHYLIRCVHRADFHFMEAYGLYYSYTQYWTHSSKGYLVHGPCFPRYTCLDIWKCTKFKRLSHYLIRCVHRADFHFMEAYGLYYSYTQYWTHSSKGYLVHGPCFPRYTCLDIQKCTKFKRLSHYLIRCVHKADFHFMEAYGLYYSYTQYWTHSSKGYLVHGPCFPRYTCLDIRKCTKFKWLSHYLIRCVHRADFHFMEAYGLYYSYTQYWTHSSKGYLVHGPCFPWYTCLDIRKCTKFKRLSHYLIRCVHRADFHFIEAYGLYYSYTQYWTHSSKGYLVHGPCFPRYTCLDIRKCTKFKRLSHYLIRCVHRADFHFMEA